MTLRPQLTFQADNLKIVYITNGLHWRNSVRQKARFGRMDATIITVE